MLVAAAAVGCGVAGAAIPLLVRAVPEPEVEESTSGPASDVEASLEPGAETAPQAPVAEKAPKMLYAEIGARRSTLIWGVIWSAFGGGLLAHGIGWDWPLLLALPLVPVLVALSIIDWHTRLLPTWLIKPTYFVALGLLALATVLSGDWGSGARALGGWLALGVFYFFLWFINSGGLGYGDVRLSGIIGLVLGYLGWAELLTGAWSAFLVGGVVGGVLAIAKMVDRKGVPFGPFMVLGALLGVLLGEWVGARFG